MELSFDLILPLIHGAARVEASDGKLCLNRFTREQTEMYRERSENFYIKSFDTAGISLEFETDSRTFGLSVEVARGCVKNFFVHSIFADGQRVGELSGVYAEGEKLMACSGEYALGEGMKRVKVYFPWTAASRITGVTLDDGAVVRPCQKERKILLFGDSITHGYDAMRPENSYASQLTDWLNAEGFNKAIGAEVFWPELALAADTIQPDLIFAAYGTNDWRHTEKETLEQNSRVFFTNLRKTYPGTSIIALAPIWRADRDIEAPMGALENVAKHYRKIAGEVENMAVIDCIDFIPHSRAYFNDGYLHPNDAGFMHYARGLTGAVGKIINHRDLEEQE